MKVDFSKRAGLFLGCFGLALTLTACGDAEHSSSPTKTSAAQVDCLPQGVAPREASARTADGRIRVYLDASLSMAGYAQAQSQDLRPLGDVLAMIPTAAAGKVQYVAFGRTLKSIASEAARGYASPAPYRCSDKPGCDNLESRIDLVLQDIQRSPPDALSVVVTDLWLSSGAVVGSPQVALGGPLSAMLTEGRAVGVVGLRAPYSGAVYDLPNGGKYEGARERPLFLLLVGPEKAVTQFISKMLDGGSPAFAADRFKYSLFSRASASAWRAGAATPLKVTSVGVTAGAAVPAPTLSHLRQYRVQLGQMKASGGGVEGEFDAARAVPRGAVWQGPLKARTHVWLLKNDGALRRCAGDTWSDYGALNGAWAPVNGSPTAAKFSLNANSASGLTAGRTYLVATYLGSAGISTPNPAAAWMRAWSFDSGDAAAVVAKRPTFFPVLNLGDIASIMESSLQRATPEGQTTVATALLVKVER
ncbi:hypothetical protein [Phenylobacterium sp.]|uniref:hypothetical protein n=1 Tax=Phenylobacterium sp. TaxID=1871053 RepID=UPI002F95640A